MKNLSLYRNFAEVIASVQKEVIVSVGDNDLESLKAAKYMLCFALGTADNYTVIWQAYDNFLSNSKFTWTPQYQLFCTNQFQEGQEVFISTNTVNINIGETSTIDEAGLLSAAVTGGNPNGFTIINDYGPIYPGINQLSTGINGLQMSTPVYVMPNQLLKGSQAVITPGEEVMVWFEQDVKTSMMFTSPRTNSIIVDMSDTNSISLLYEDGAWKKM